MKGSKSYSYADTSRKYPLFKRNLKLEELYKKYEKKYNKMFIKKQLSKSQVVWAVAVLVIFASIPIALNLIQKQQEIRTRAQLGKSAFAVEPERVGRFSGNIAVGVDNNASSQRFIQFGPESDKTAVISCPQIPGTTGKVEMELDIPKDGKYYLWSRIMAKNPNEASYYLQANGNCAIVVGNTPLLPNTWQWVYHKSGNLKERIVLGFTRGKHKIILAGRGADLKIDRLILTQDEQCIPVLTGENCL